MPKTHAIHRVGGRSRDSNRQPVGLEHLQGGVGVVVHIARREQQSQRALVSALCRREAKCSPLSSSTRTMLDAKAHYADERLKLDDLILTTNVAALALYDMLRV